MSHLRRQVSPAGHLFAHTLPPFPVPDTPASAAFAAAFDIDAGRQKKKAFY